MPATIPFRLSATAIRSVPAPRPARRPGLLGLLLGVFARSHQFVADRELVHRLSFRDIKLTDELERRMSEYFLRNPNLRL